MLTAVVLHLQPVGEARIPVSHGSFTYAAALELFLRLDPALSRALHETASHKPLTSSSLAGPAQRGDFELLLTPDQVYTWRLTGLTPEVSCQLLRLSPALGGIRIGEAVFAIADVSTIPEQDSEAGQDDYGVLAARWETQPGPPTVTLQFLTPTTFRTGRFEQPFPLPRWVFGSLLDAWNAFAPHPLGDLRDLVERTTVLSNWRGETRRVELGSHRTVGFLGRFTYRVVEPPPEVRRLIGLLAEFAFYAGVGWQTTHGLGQVRPEFPTR